MHACICLGAFPSVLECIQMLRREYRVVVTHYWLLVVCSVFITTK
jgi:hypothetical protein